MSDANQNNGSNVVSVNTNSIAMFANDGTMLKFSFKNDRIIFTITPRVVDESTGRQKWPKELGHSAILPPTTAAAFYNAIMLNLYDEIRENRDHNGFLTVPLNRDCTALIGLSWVNNTATLAIFNNVNPDRTCTNIHTFQFQITTSIDNYDPQSGNFTVKEVQGQLYLFIETLAAFDNVIGGACAHSVKNISNYNYNQIMNHLKAIAIKVGASIQTNYTSQYGNGNTNTSSSGGNETVNYTTGYQESAMADHIPQTEVETIGSLQDMLA